MSPQDAALFLPTAYLEYDARGRVKNAGSMGLEHIIRLEESGKSIFYGGSGDGFLEYEEFWIDTASGTPERVPRPSFDPDLVASRQVPPRALITLPAIPPARVTYSGPMSGSLEHEGGDLAIGFVLPGAYVLAFEAFPYKPVTMDIEVNP